MACGQSYYEDNPVKDKLREERTAEKHQKGARKILDFFTTNPDMLGTACITTANVGYDVKKIKLIIAADVLYLQHRGHEITIVCQDPSSLSVEFRKWIAANMTHITKIEPHAH